MDYRMPLYIQLQDIILKKIDIDYQNEVGNSGISAIFREKGIQISNRVLGMGDITGSKYINYKLRQKEAEAIWGLHRVHFGDGRPFAIEYTYVPKKYFNDIESFDFSKVSLYDYMEANNHLPVHFIQNLIICSANEKIADLLNVKKGSAVFKIEYQASDKDYNLVEYTKSYLNPEFAEFRFIAEAE